MKESWRVIIGLRRVDGSDRRGLRRSRRKGIIKQRQVAKQRMKILHCGARRHMRVIEREKYTATNHRPKLYRTLDQPWYVERRGQEGKK